MIDTHIHLYDSSFNDDRDEVVTRAKDAGITHCVLPGIDSTCFDALIKCCQAYPNFAFPAIGLHPTSIGENWESELNFVIENSLKHNYCAIGEIGIDCYWSKEFLAEQKIAFKEQLLLANRLNLPVIIHSREAWEQIFEVFDLILEEGNCLPKGVFHAFSGSYEIYKRILTYGDYKFGIGGVVTYKKASLPEVVSKMDISDILLETDAPYLPPVPFRGKRNELSYLRYIAEKIAESKGVSTDEVMEITSNNALNIFKLLNE